MKNVSLLKEPVEFFRAISSALDVLRWSIRKLGILNGGTCMLSDENWWRSGRCRSGDGNDKLSNFSLLRCWRSMQSSISWRTWLNIVINSYNFHSYFFIHWLKLTSNNVINCSKFNDGFTVWGNNDGITLVAITFTDNPYFLSLNIIR